MRASIPVNAGALVVAAQQEKILGVLNLVGHEQADGLQRVLSPGKRGQIHAEYERISFELEPKRVKNSHVLNKSGANRLRRLREKNWIPLSLSGLARKRERPFSGGIVMRLTTFYCQLFFQMKKLCSSRQSGVLSQGLKNSGDSWCAF